LDAGASTHDNWIAILIRSQDGAPPDARFVADRNVADQNSGGCDKRGGSDVRSFPFVLDNHAASTSVESATTILDGGMEIKVASRGAAKIDSIDRGNIARAEKP
jgi:hypothetical protein